jgi:hypothetical protein
MNEIYKTTNPYEQLLKIRLVYKEGVGLFVWAKLPMELHRQPIY